MRRLLLLPLTLVAVGAGGCGSDDDSSAPSGTADTGTSTAAAAAPAGKAVEVGMTDDLEFDPKEVTVKVGTKVTWKNRGDVPHNATATSGADFKSDTFGKDGTFSYTPTKAGTIKYVCTIHPGMDGTLTVVK